MAMEQLIGKLPNGIGYEWTGTSLQEQQSGDFAPILDFDFVYSYA